MRNPLADQAAFSGIDIAVKDAGSTVMDWLGQEHVMADDKAVIASRRLLYVTPSVYETIKRKFPAASPQMQGRAGT